MATYESLRNYIAHAITFGSLVNLVITRLLKEIKHQKNDKPLIQDSKTNHFIHKSRINLQKSIQKS